MVVSIRYVWYIQIMTSYDEALGFTVQQHLFALEMTRASLGEVLGVPGTSVSNRLRGKIKWTAEDLTLTAAEFGVSVDALMPRPDGAGGWVPAAYVPGARKGPVSGETGPSGLVAGTGFEPATSGL